MRIDPAILAETLQSERLQDELIQAVATEYDRQAGEQPTPPVDPIPDTDFRVFEDINYAGRPNLSDFGMEPAQLFYEKSFFQTKARPGEGDMTFPLAGTIKAAANKARKTSFIDIERWWSGNGKPLMPKAVHNYTEMMRQYQAALPAGHEAGLYSTIPIRHYWAVVRGGSRLNEWMKSNDDLLPIVPHIDFTAPSIYAFYDDRLNWVKYAKAQISEAKRLAPDKPCYPYLWPEYHPGEGPIEPVFWRLQLDTIAKHADGVVIWTEADTKTIPFIRAKPWWDATVRFLDDLR